jgi:hypothetical protein
LRAHAINSLDNFVAGWYSDQHQLCSDIISYHAANDPQQGKVGDRVDLAVKDSRDCVLAGDLAQHKWIATGWLSLSGEPC